MKKAWTEDLEARKPRSCKVSCTSQDEWGKHEESKKGPDYKQMQYLTFAPMSEMELVIFEKCSFDQPPPFTSIPSASFGQAIPKLQDHLQQNHLLTPAEPEEH